MKYLSISYATQTTPGELIPAPTEGKRIKVYGLHLVSAGTVTATLKSAATALTGAMSMAAGVPFTLPVSGTRLDGALAHMRCAPEEALNIVLGGAVQVSGWVAYDVEIE